MKVLITGGTGAVGQAAVSLLTGHGHEVTVIGRREGLAVPGANYRVCDVSDYEALRTVMIGHDAVVHLAAYNSPVGVVGREVFRVNALGTFNVFEAAASLGIVRIVGASSINAVGYFFGDRGVKLEYLPIDEEHPLLATDAYSFSKQSMEAIGRYFWERDGITSVMLRLPGVIPHEDIVNDVERYADYDMTVVERLLTMPVQRRKQELERLQTEYDAFRHRNRCDEHQGTGWWAEPDRECTLSVDELRFMHHKVNFFTYVDELDSAQAILGGLTSTYSGSHALFINSHRNALGLPLAELAKFYAPDKPDLRPVLPGDDSVVSIGRARSLIGFEPEWVVTGRFSDSG
ncbi:MAG: NAD(P)-dependent oxidoreductase [Spirochaetaceae bacterium]|nr:MAG: NAD(P)-dependent oxidoreductase [Spirochaetaceae bacterium]